MEGASVVPRTRYARSRDGVAIAYQVVGDGPVDLVFVWGWVSNVEVIWEEPAAARFLDRLASFSRLISFDKRGTGLSDPVPADEPPDVEVRMDDLRAVMDAAGSGSAAVLGFSEGAAIAALFAATYPERTRALVLWGGTPRQTWAEDYPWGSTREEGRRFVDLIKRGDVAPVAWFCPSMAGDPAFEEWWQRYARHSASPQMAISLMRMNAKVDIRDVLPAIRVPTLVMHRTDDVLVDVGGGRYFAEHIPGARYVELPGRDHWPWTGAGADEILDEIESFLTGAPPASAPDRVLATLLFTDIVGSSSRAARVGDRRWRETIATHDSALGTIVEHHRGRVVKGTGDGLLATFPAPGRAIAAATACRAAARDLGLEIRAGVHTGEIELAGDDVAGLAVHTAARIVDAADPGEVLVSRTVTDLVAGSPVTFDERGERVLDGIPGTWSLFAVRDG